MPDSVIKPRCLLVIPHYKDTDRLRPFLGELVRSLGRDFAVLVSDDGSGPAEFERLGELVAGMTVAAGEDAPILCEPITSERNRGKGAAVRAGWDCGREFEFLAFTDADGAVGAREIRRCYESFIERIEEHDVLIGSRVRMLGRQVERRLVRHLSGRVFATAVSLLTGLNSYDTQCGLKLLKREVFEEISAECQSSGFAFDVELLLLAIREGFRIKEFPLDWRDIAGTKVNLLFDSLPMLLEVRATARRVGAAKAKRVRKTPIL